jgi:hypothetical protein
MAAVLKSCEQTIVQGRLRRSWHPVCPSWSLFRESQVAPHTGALRPRRLVTAKRPKAGAHEAIAMARASWRYLVADLAVPAGFGRKSFASPLMSTSNSRARVDTAP